MSEQFVFKSVFASYLNDFIKMKETLGVDIERIKWMLLELDKFFIHTGVTDVYLTKSIFDSWKSTRINDKRKTLYDKICMLRQFCRYLCHIGKECYIPRLPKKEYPNFTPYVFTHEQIHRIFTACDNRRMSSRNMYCNLFSLPTLYRLLYGTGMRIGEATALKNEDVDIMRQRIIIKKTKNKKQRFIPINDSLSAVLKQYIEYRNKMPLPNVNELDSFLLISPAGKPLSSCTVLQGFKRVLRECEIPCSSNRDGACIHSLRHTFAVHSLAKMVKEGMDIYCALPVLSVFLGHKTLKGTETYVRLTMEMFPEVLQMQNTITRFVYPEIDTIKPKITIDYGND
jgi:integrase